MKFSTRDLLPKRRWYQFSLKTLLMMTSAAAVYCGIARTIWALTDWDVYIEWIDTGWRRWDPPIWYQILQSGVCALGIVFPLLLVTFFARRVYRNNFARSHGKA